MLLDFTFAIYKINISSIQKESFKKKIDNFSTCCQLVKCFFLSGFKQINTSMGYVMHIKLLSLL